MKFRRLIVCALAALVTSVSVSEARAQAASSPMAALAPSYASNALFVKTSGGGQEWFYLATGLKFDKILGKDVITGSFFVLDGVTPAGAVVVLPTNVNNEFWFISSQGPWGLITVHSPNAISWVDGQSNSGYILLY